MADKEKLIKLLYSLSCESELEGEPGSCQDRKNGRCREVDRLDICAIQHIADHLIANGVTIQNWIPVTERLPEVNTDVTVYNIEGYIGTDFRTTNGNWFWNDELPVTHWMPLPKPPKEVDHDS